MRMRSLKRSLLLFIVSYAVLSAHYIQVAPKAVTLSDGGHAEMPPKGGKFPHAQTGKNGLKGHREVACGECHALGAQPPYLVKGKPSPKVERPVDSPFPGHASCVSCHNFALMSFVKPAFCGICHQQNPQSPAQPGLFDKFQTAPDAGDFGIAFSHLAHRQPLPINLALTAAAGRSPALERATLKPGVAPLCTDCHAPVQPARANQPELTMETGHTTCFTCHLQAPAGHTTQSKQAFPDRNDCRGCHALSESGLPKQQAPGLFQHAKVAEFRHADHALDTRSVKKSEARVVKAPDYLCVECHRTVAGAANLNDIRAPGLSSCTACHNEKRKPGLPEPLSAAVLQTLREK
jgi:hypothetical protein